MLKLEIKSEGKGIEIYMKGAASAMEVLTMSHAIGETFGTLLNQIPPSYKESAMDALMKGLELAKKEGSGNK